MEDGPSAIPGEKRSTAGGLWIRAYPRTAAQMLSLGLFKTGFILWAYCHPYCAKQKCNKPGREERTRRQWGSHVTVLEIQWTG